MTHIDPAVRKRIRDGARRSAHALGELFVETLNLPDGGSVLDVGCGEGFLTDWFRGQGFSAHGVDGDDLLGVDQIVDLRQPLGLSGFDLVVCLEVGEHLPDSAAETLVDSLCDAAPVIAFSAAIPRQGGPGHINEQWPEYWVEKFARRGLQGTGVLRSRIWEDTRIEPWYRQNLLVFGSGLPFDGCPALVHPEIWGWYR